MSFANNQVFGDDVTKTYTSAVYPLGTERLVLGSQTGVGDQVYVFVYNADSADYALGDLIRHKATSANGTTIKTAGAVNPSYLVGIAAGTLPYTAAADGSSGPYGWIIKKGVCTAKVTTYTQDNALVSSATAGTCDTTATAATATFGYGLGAASGGLAQVYVNII